MSNEDEYKVAEGAVGKAVDALRTHIKSGTKEAYQCPADAAWIVEFTHDMEKVYLSAWMRLDAVDIIATSTTPSTFEIAEEDGIPYGSTPVTDSAAPSTFEIAEEYDMQLAAATEEGNEMRVEIDRLREALKQVCSDLDGMDILPEGGKIAMVRAMKPYVAQALNPKGEQGGTSDRGTATTTNKDQPPVDSPRGSASEEPDISLLDNDQVSGQGMESNPAPLKLDRLDMYENELPDRGEIIEMVDNNSTAIEHRDVEVVAAIAEAKHILGERIKNVLTGQKRMQEQIDSLWERTDIYVDLQEKQRRQIDALNATANRALGMAQAAAEGIGDVRRTIESKEAK